MENKQQVRKKRGTENVVIKHNKLGRPKGSLNVTTKALRDCILGAAEKHGYDGKGKDGMLGYCFRLARDEPRAFAGLMGRILPTEVVGGVDVRFVVRLPERIETTEEWVKRFALPAPVEVDKLQ